MSSHTFYRLLVATAVVVAVSCFVLIRRPAGRWRPLVKVVLGSSAIALALEIGFFVLLLWTLSSMPDMRDF